MERAINLRLRYGLCLLALGTLAGFQYYTASEATARQAADARLINVAGRQRMLSERIAKEAWLVERGTPGARQRLIKAHSQWVVGRAALTARRGMLKVWGRNSTASLRLLTSTRNVEQELSSEVGALLNDHGGAAQAAANIAAKQPRFIKGMEALVLQYQREAEARVVAARELELQFFLGTLGLLLLVMFGVMEPSRQLIRRQVARLRGTLADAEHAEESKNLFLKAMSRDLRQPVGAAKRSLEALQHSRLTAAQNEHVREMQDALRTAERELDDLLALADGAAVQGASDVFEVATVVQAVIATRKGSAEKAHVDISWSGPEQDWVLGDVQLLRRVLGALLDDALDRPFEGAIAIRRWEGRELDLVVEREREPEGGVECAFAGSLSACKQLVERAQGTLARTERVEGGTRATLRLPYGKTEPPERHVHELMESGIRPSVRAPARDEHVI